MYFRRVKILFFLIVISGLLVNCKKKQDKLPEGIINKEIMTNILVDVNLLESAVRISDDSKNKDSLQGSDYYNAVFSKHKVTKPQFDNSIQYYSKHPDKFGEIYDEVINKLSRMQTEESSKQSTVHNPQNTTGSKKPAVVSKKPGISKRR